MKAKQRLIFLVLFSSSSLLFLWISQNNATRNMKLFETRSRQLEQPPEVTNQTKLKLASTNQSQIQIKTHFNKRKLKVREFCRQQGSASWLYTPVQRGSKTSQIPHYLIVNEKYKLVFCPIPKSGCTTFIATMLMLDGVDPIHFQGRVWQYIYERGIRYIRHYNRKRQKEILRDYYKVMIVRDPLERLLSAYTDKFIPRGQPVHPHTWMDRLSKDATGRAANKTTLYTFQQFLKLILKLKPGKFNGHWNRYHDHCNPCSIDYDFIGNTKQLSKEIPYILDKIHFWADELPKKTFHENKVKRPAKNRTRYYADIPRDVIKAIWNVYKGDYEMFGYNYTIPNL